MIVAKDLIDKNFPTIGPDDSISGALPILESSNEIVIMGENNYHGFLVKRDIMKAKLSMDAKISTFLRHVAKIQPDESAHETARLMLESGVYQLPVLIDNELLGVVRAEALLRKAAETPFGNEPIKNYMSTDVITVEPDDNLGKAIKLFKEKDISRLPVIEDGRVKGLITMDDIIDKVFHPEDKAKGVGEYGEFIAEKKHYLKIAVKEVMDKAPVTMSPDAKIKKVIEYILKNNLRGIMVGTDKNLQGIITKKDLLEPVASYERGEQLTIQFAGDLDSIEGFDKEDGRSYLIDVIKKHEDFLGTGYIYVHIKRHKGVQSGSSLIYCKIRLSSPRGMFVASEEGWGFAYALKNAAATIERQIRREKER